MALYAKLTPLEEDIIALLNRKGAMSIPCIERELGRGRKDPEVKAAIVRLKSFGIIRRKTIEVRDPGHWTVYELL